jgi:hypothetical protein
MLARSIRHSKKASLIKLALFFSACAIAAPCARPFSDSNACRGVVEGVMKGNVELAIAAINPDSSDADGLREAVTKMARVLGGAFKEKTPRLERTLPDIHVENYPTSLQIWSFGDKEVHFVGCLIRQRGRQAQIHLQVHPIVDELAKNLKVSLNNTN